MAFKIGKSLYLAREKETLKSYIALENLDPNKYVIVPIPNHLRNNEALKSVNFNVSNPSYKYMMVLKDYVAIQTHSNGSARPVLKITELKQNKDAEKENNSHSEKNNPEFIKQFGKMNNNPDKKNKSVYDQIYEDFISTDDFSTQMFKSHVAKLKSKEDDKFKEVMDEFKEGELHSGSKKGPKVKKKKQAVAIAMNVSGKGKKNKSTEKGSIEFDDIIDVEDTSVAANLPESKHKMKGINKSLKDACWEGYEAIGTKMKNGKKVPNCVPKGKKDD